MIGSGATHPITAGDGSAAVVAPFVSTHRSPLCGPRSGRSTTIRYAQGGVRSIPLRSITTGQTISRRYFDTDEPHLHADRVEPGKDDISVVEARNVTDAVATATTPGTGKYWSSWSETITPRSSGIYRIGLHEVGDTWLTMNGAPVLSSAGLHTPNLLSSAVSLRAGVHYTFAIRWFSVDGYPAPAFGITDETAQFDAAIAAARRASVAVVFTGELQREGADRSLALPGDADQLIAAVAAVNPHTVVVINSGGAVLHAVAGEGGRRRRGLVPGRGGRHCRGCRPDRSGRPFGTAADHVPNVSNRPARVHGRRVSRDRRRV